jgi:hypothetical protein
VFDFDAAVSSPFRMQPGLRRLPAGVPQLTPLAPGSRHQREKLAVLSAFWAQALVQQPGFDAQPALHALCTHAQAEHPQAWHWQDGRAHAVALGTAVDRLGNIEQTAVGVFGLGDEVARCLQGLPAPWRLAGLLSLAFAEDFAVVDGDTGLIPWLAVCLPSHWAPEEKVGRHFADVHAPVADNTLLVKASSSLTKLVTGPERWERFVWNVTDQPRLHAHPARAGHGEQRWSQTAVDQAWWRTERQTFVPVPELGQAVFTIHVQVQPLVAALSTAAQAQALHGAISSMSPSVLAYRGLQQVQPTLLAWLVQHAQGLA